MTRKDVVENTKKKFSSKIKKLFEKSKKRLFVDIEGKDLPEFTKYLFLDLGARFNITSAVDTPEAIELIYHFTIDQINLMICLRARLNRKDPHIESITPIMKGASWIEREIHELFGVEFDNHPNLEPLLLPDNWPKGKHPLRRDFKL